MEEFRRRTASGAWCSMRQLAVETGISAKRAAYITAKWTRRGWYDYGVHCLAGWLTDEGRTAEFR